MVSAAGVAELSVLPSKILPRNGTELPTPRAGFYCTKSALAVSLQRHERLSAALTHRVLSEKIKLGLIFEFLEFLSCYV